jgi:predicted deacylase
MTRTTITTDIDLGRPGKQVGSLRLPYSPDDDAYGFIPIPIAVIANGAGPTVLITGGVHGDELEGPLVIGELIRQVRPEDVRGRLILVPCTNAPAVLAGTRTSPIDRANMARAFPGAAFGQPTEQIAHYVHAVLFPLADWYLDLHAGGNTLMHALSSLVFPADGMDPGVKERCLELARTFGAPTTVIVRKLGDGRTPVASAAASGIPGISVEMGSGGQLMPEGVRMCRDGVHRVLRMTGVLPDAHPPAPGPSRLTEIKGPQSYLVCPEDGWFERAFEVDERVEAGQVAGRLHFFMRPQVEPLTLRFESGGWVWGHRSYARSRAGSALAVVVESLDGKP